MTAQLMTQTQFARHRGVSKGSVTNWKKAGLLVLAEGPASKPMVDVVRSELKLNANIDPLRGRPTTGGQGAAPDSPGGDAPALPLGEGPAAPTPGPSTSQRDDLATARLQESKEKTVGAALKNAQLAGDLVALIEAERRVAEVGRATRERVHAWFRGVAEQLASLNDVRAIMVLGEEGIDDVFAQLARAAIAGDFGAIDDEDLTPEEDAEMEAAAADEGADA